MLIFFANQMWTHPYGETLRQTASGTGSSGILLNIAHFVEQTNTSTLQKKWSEMHLDPTTNLRMKAVSTKEGFTRLTRKSPVVDYVGSIPADETQAPGGWVSRLSLRCLFGDFVRRRSRQSRPFGGHRTTWFHGLTSRELKTSIRL